MAYLRKNNHDLYSTVNGNELEDEKRVFYNTGGLSLRS